MNAARAGVELALLDAYSRHFRRDIGEAVGWLGLAGLGSPGSARRVRYSAVLSGGEVRRYDSARAAVRHVFRAMAKSHVDGDARPS